MIDVKIYRNDDADIVGYHISGHADYAPKGKDIVCAGVSAVTVGTANAIQSLLSLPLEHEMAHGLLKVQLPHIAEEAKHQKAQLLLEAMVVMLQSIEQSYSEHITIAHITV